MSDRLDTRGKGFVAQLMSGDFGLAKTYWMYGVGIGLVFNVVTGFVTTVSALVVVMLAYMVYIVPVLIGIWNASEKYTGLVLWRAWAKLSVISPPRPW